MAAMTVSMLTTPWLLARYGYRRTYMACMWLLLVGGVAGGFANDYPLVLAARVAEGLAAGVVQPIPAIIILRAFEPHEQGAPAASSAWGWCWRRPSGPASAACWWTLFGWRSIFFMVVPFCLVSLWLARATCPPPRRAASAANPQGAALDWRGLLLATRARCACSTAWSTARRHAAGGPALLGRRGGLLVVSWCCSGARCGPAAATPTGHRPAHEPVAVQADRRFAMGSIVAFIYGIALFGSTYLLPVYMQMGLGLSAAHVGTVLLPAGLVLAVTIAMVGRLADRQPTHRLVSIGLVLLAASFALMVTIDLGRPAQIIPLLVVWAILGRIGLGFILPSLNIGAMRGLERTHIPQGPA
jgi:predicted MFS family arabinose efflux permease